MNPALALDRDSIVAPLHRFAHMAMNCDWEIFIAGEDAEYARQAAFAAWDEVDRIEEQISRFMPGSDVMRLNAAQPGDEIRIGPTALDCLLLANEISEQTQGAFDVMVGRAMDRIRAGENSGPEFLPNAPLLEMDAARGIARVLGEGVAIDFGALGKGYAVDRVLAVLREWSIENALAHSGSSSCAALGTPPGCDGWPVGLRDPRDASNEATLGRVSLCNAALSGSGFQTQGHHIIDPRNGTLIKGRIGSWALCRSAARSDGVSTALMVMAPDEIDHFFAQNAEDSGLVLLGSARKPQVVGSGFLAEVKLDFDAFTPPEPAPDEPPEISLLADPIVRPFVGHRATLVWPNGAKQSGVLIAASADWLHLQSDDGATILVPREAIAWIDANPKA